MEMHLLAEEALAFLNHIIMTNQEIMLMLGPAENLSQLPVDLQH